MNNKVENISHASLFLGLGVLALLDSWWPGLLIVLGIFFTLKNFLSKKYFKMVSTALFFAGAYFCIRYPMAISWSFMLPLILFTLAAEKLFKEFIWNRKKT